MPPKKKISSKSIYFSYKVSIQDPHLNYYHVELTVKLKKDKITLSMPAWSPGSYLIRDYSGQLHNFQAIGINGKPIPWTQVNLSEWEIQSDNKPFTVKYRIYAFENSVRTNFLDTEYGFINPPSLFLYHQSNLKQKVEVSFELNEHFKYTYTALTKKENGYIAFDFDELFDCPFLISNNESSSFESSGCLHEVIIQGEISKTIKNNLLNDLKKITEYESALMGVNPNSYYLFILNMTEDHYGGLEHSNSSVNSFDPSKLSERVEYIKLLGLLSHEYFHLWNVKRIRPLELFPFDYQKPVLTKDLWVAEGITSFYDNHVLFRCNFFSADEYLAELMMDITRLEDSCGEESMSLDEASFTAWTKFYKQGPNSHNTGLSYYVKGAILVLCMNIYILKHTDCKRTFVDILKALYQKYYVKKNRGFTRKEFFETAEEATGLVLLDKFEKYLSDSIRIPVYDYLEDIGVRREKVSSKTSFGFDVKEKEGKLVIVKLFQHKNAGKTDINLNDELIAVDEIRVDKEMLEILKSNFTNGQEVELLLARRGKIIKRKLKCEIQKTYKLVLDPFASDRILKIRDAFFGWNL